jgi:hypothetical protein
MLESAAAHWYPLGGGSAQTVRLPTGRRVEGAAKQIFSTKKKFSALKNLKIFSQIKAKSINMFFKVYNFC